MYNKFRNLSILILIALAIGLYFLKGAFTKNSSESWKQTCVEDTAEAIRSLYTSTSDVLGIKESEIGSITQEAAIATCDCIISLSKGKDLKTYAAQPENKEKIKECSREKQKKILDKYTQN